ncbi:MAG: ATP-binding protein [Ardenticatenaceae bacterium]|nr:ATP-binding protein [Ardenticatenaceae bacterium]MCB9003323.1 ATP-binding protein [Ardenticatenaceae bacterium]
MKIGTTHKLPTVKTSPSRYSPPPLVARDMLLGTAHRFAPAAADVVSAGILKEALGEGRKFGLGLALISQRPGKLDADVLNATRNVC